jgi:hypothetical protein
LLIQADGLEGQHAGQRRWVVHGVHVTSTELSLTLADSAPTASHGKPPDISHAYRSLTS